MTTVTTPATAALSRMFLAFADREFRGSSPVYDRLARACAERPQLGAPLLAAPPGQRRALLLFAAVQYLLRRNPDESLAGWYPTLGGRRSPDPALVDAFAGFCARHCDDIGALCAGRTTQTNEARRAAVLRPALGRVARAFPGQPVHLIDIGTSAGLLLFPDRYGYDYAGRRHGLATAPAALQMRCELRGGVPEGLDDQPVIADRTGLDLAPVTADDRDATDWLRACVWPEHTERLVRLEAALAVVAAEPPRMIAGDVRDTLPTALARTDGLPLVQTSNTLTYLPGDAWRELIGELDAVGRRRDLAVVVNEATSCGAALFAPVPASPGAMTAPTVVIWRGGTATVEVLGTAGPHGDWLDWAPTRYGYAPALA